MRKIGSGNKRQKPVAEPAVCNPQHLKRHSGGFLTEHNPVGVTTSHFTLNKNKKLIFIHVIVTIMINVFTNDICIN